MIEKTILSNQSLQIQATPCTMHNDSTQIKPSGSLANSQGSQPTENNHDKQTIKSNTKIKLQAISNQKCQTYNKVTIEQSKTDQQTTASAQRKFIAKESEMSHLKISKNEKKQENLCEKTQISEVNAGHRLLCGGQVIANSKKNIVYKVIENIGTGTFGQVLSVVSLTKGLSGNTYHKMALKVIKKQPAYINQGLMQIKNLRQIAKYEQLIQKKMKETNEQRQENIVDEDKNYLRLYDGFMWQGHLCIAMELMDNSILNILQSNQYKGIDMKWIEKWGKSILLYLAKIHRMQIIHCDIKPENIMFRPEKPDKPILIDFSSSCTLGSQIFTYIQSRFYRSPEVLIGTLPYTSKIDIWSLGCVLLQMYLGLPIFPGASSYDQVAKIHKLTKNSFGQQTIQMIKNSKFGLQFFSLEQENIKDSKNEQLQNEQNFRRNKRINDFGNDNIKLSYKIAIKSIKQYKKVIIVKFQQKMQKVQINQQYFNISDLEQIISIRNPNSKDLQTHELFLDLVKKLLVFEPQNRFSADQAFLHPFFGGTFSQLESVRVIEDLLYQQKINNKK